MKQQRSLFQREDCQWVQFSEAICAFSRNPAVSDQLSHNGANLSYDLNISISKLISPMYSARVSVNNQAVVLPAAAPAR